MRAREELTQIIRKAFEDADIKQNVVAVAAGVKSSTVSRWLSGDIILPPIPDPLLEQKLSQIFANLSLVSSDCNQGIANNDVNQIDQMGALMTTVNSEVANLTNAITSKAQG